MISSREQPLSAAQASKKAGGAAKQGELPAPGRSCSEVNPRKTEPGERGGNWLPHKEFDDLSNEGA